MPYKTKIILECSYGLYQPWELQEAIIIHGVVLTYTQLRIMAIKQVGGSYTTYGVMTILEES